MDPLEKALHEDRAACLARGHSWDVADVMAVIRRVQADREGSES